LSRRAPFERTKTNNAVAITWERRERCGRDINHRPKCLGKHFIVAAPSYTSQCGWPRIFWERRRGRASKRRASVHFGSCIGTRRQSTTFDLDVFWLRGGRKEERNTTSNPPRDLTLQGPARRGCRRRSSREPSPGPFQIEEIAVSRARCLGDGAGPTTISYDRSPEKILHCSMVITYSLRNPYPSIAAFQLLIQSGVVLEIVFFTYTIGNAPIARTSASAMGYPPSRASTTMRHCQPRA